jgi:NTP pyrophosphatase (non-canonical NTP hydrolase)
MKYELGFSDSNAQETMEAALALAGFCSELQEYRASRNRPNNALYYTAKLAEEAGEVAEAAVAMEGSRRKVKKLKERGETPRQALVNELGDVFNVVFLLAEQKDINVTEIIKAGRRKLYKKRTGN